MLYIWPLNKCTLFSGLSFLASKLIKDNFRAPEWLAAIISRVTIGAQEKLRTEMYTKLLIFSKDWFNGKRNCKVVQQL